MLAAVKQKNMHLDLLRWSSRRTARSRSQPSSRMKIHFKHAAPELKMDRKLIFEAVKQYEYALTYAAPELKADRKFLFAVVKQNRNSLELRPIRARRTVKWCRSRKAE